MLQDLSKLVVPIREKIELFRGIDMTLPAAFKEAVQSIGSDKVAYGKYSSVITNASGQHIFLSNNWFYIAAILSPLYRPFEEYRVVINKVVDKDVLKKKDKEQISKAIDANRSYDNTDKEFLKKFATDCGWWTANAAKDLRSLDRGDCLNSAILAIANVVNASQSYIANLWSYFGSNPLKANLLTDGFNEFMASKSTVIAERNLALFVFKTMKVLEGDDKLSAFVPYAQTSNARTGTGEAKLIKLRSDDFSETLVGLFIETTLQDIKERNSSTPTTRWFEEPFEFMDKQVYLSNQWVSAGDYQLSFPELQKYIDVCYRGKYHVERTNDGLFVLFQISDPNNILNYTDGLPSYKSDKPLQLIYYGAPGTSKSTTIKKEIGNCSQHRITFHPDTDYSNFVGCYKPTKDTNGHDITYEFVAQTFVKAYIEAWKKLIYENDKDKRVFLIIEEINRGNCAQIFGDLFQLLDRDDKGYSDYEIEPDTDLQRYLAKEFGNCGKIPEHIAYGDIMKLPPNLFIWATMNTSDQSLFPIDSAFKRRWEWKYLPIKNGEKGHIIRVDDTRAYDWWEFLNAVNNRIEKLTEQEDKQLGYWFAKPNTGVEISVDRFVSKVVFYLWNDVFKDFAKDANSPFVIKGADEKRHELKFNMFFDKYGNAIPEIVAIFIEGLKVLPIKGPGHTAENAETEEPEEINVVPEEIEEPEQADAEEKKEIEEYNETAEPEVESDNDGEDVEMHTIQQNLFENDELEVDKEDDDEETGSGNADADNFLKALYNKKK